MIRQGLRRTLQRLGYDVRRVGRTPDALVGRRRRTAPPAPPPPVAPRWPLPRGAAELSDEDVRATLARHDRWHYGYEFEAESPDARIRPDEHALTAPAERHLMRFRHFMPYVLQSQGGSLRGKRVLDIGCNAGFWSIQCAFLGADVVGFDARPELIEQAELVNRIVGANVDFRVLDFGDMTREALGGTFDVVLNLGLLYHLADPLEALDRTRRMASGVVLLDTGISPSRDAVIELSWEEPSDIRNAADRGVVASPSRSGVELMLLHLGVAAWFEVPLRSRAMPADYLEDRRASWLIAA